MRTSSDRPGPSVHRALESRDMRSETRERHFSSPSPLLERGMASRMNLYFLCRFIWQVSSGLCGLRRLTFA